MASQKITMKWNDEKDIIMLRKIMVRDPFQFKARTQQRGNVWKEIAAELQRCPAMNFQGDARAIRDRWNILKYKGLKNKIRKKRLSSGVSPEHTEGVKLIEDLINKERDVEATKEEKEEAKKGR
ncbi:uncharacterized protein LOC117118596 isoform X2 [Anneissia japonica]|uniref:uncharacterized protein LOC117118596 isoform X2 n=1 Tax=Anneissia japonica TaxID=1529436 RepID=UPI001425646D|nr:uncharacterized protein LOC117118596 isoform X2 [Anneissia japonica]